LGEFMEIKLLLKMMQLMKTHLIHCLRLKLHY